MALSQITWRQIQEQTPEDGKRREAIGGELYVSPAPNIRHQRVSKRLQREALRLLEDPGHGEVLDAPVGVEFPATAQRDRGLKRDLYERQGVRQYWIVDPEADAVEVWIFGEDPDQTTRERFTATLPVRLRGTALGEIDLQEVFTRER